jgi:GH24 family phage-related lysozyme (muramidase)
VHLLIGSEIGAEYTGDTRYYNKYLIHPTWPGASSGITIGFGYDCGMNTREQILRDWQGYVPGNILAYLVSCSGVYGANAKAKLLPHVKLFNIPYKTAFDVFTKSTLPRYCTEAINAFPGLEKLNPDTQAVVVSVVFNRGTRMKDSGEKEIKEHAREEMRGLKVAIANADYDEIAREVESMKRLWDGIPDFEGDAEEKFNGLVERRMSEAALVRRSPTALLDTVITVHC